MSRYLPIRYLILISIMLASGLFAHNCLPKDLKAETGLNHSELPEGYETWPAKDKADWLWTEIEKSRWSKLPELEGINPFKFLFAHLHTKMDLASDLAPLNYEKSIHKHGVVARVRFESMPNNYTGLYQGFEESLLRLSVTSAPKGKDFAPGLAWKILVDGKPSENLSALFQLSGQADNHNFFANELSNIIPIELALKSLVSQANFVRVSKHPTKVSVVPLASLDAHGESVEKIEAPTQLYFVPNPELSFASTPHDFREDLLNLVPGTWLYEVWATKETGENFRTIDKERRSKAQKIGRLIMKTSFIASQFGDERLFFRHHRYEDYE